MNREQLLNEIQALEFYIQELNLYLNTHPEDEDVINLYNQALERYFELTTQFENRFGPLTRRARNNSRIFEWIRGPWPWERRGNPRPSRPRPPMPPPPPPQRPPQGGRPNDRPNDRPNERPNDRPGGNRPPQRPENQGGGQ